MTISEEKTGAGPRYIIDPSRARELGRNLEVLLLSRRCASCKERLARNPEPLPAEEQIREIEECCARAEGFITPEMPMLEILFRTLLSEGNRPMALEELLEVLTERYATPSNPRSITPEGLRRVLNTDFYYCFRELAPE